MAVRTVTTTARTTTSNPSAYTSIYEVEPGPDWNTDQASRNRGSGFGTGSSGTGSRGGGTWGIGRIIGFSILGLLLFVFCGC